MMKHTFKRIYKRISGAMLHRSFLAKYCNKTRELEQLSRMRLSNLTPINQPLILISQIPRSGGTLLSQLFDGHPQCHTHPLELHIGYPKRARWPDLNLNDAANTWCEQLFEKPISRLCREGYSKYPKKLYTRQDNFPFLFFPTLQRDIFMHQVAETDITSQRDVLNCYMTSYFNAWLDYQELYRADKKYLVAFVPRTGCAINDFSRVCEADTNRFFTDYPDGKLLSVVRDPKTWYVSARRFGFKRISNVHEGVALWKASVHMMLSNKQHYGEQVYLLRFEDVLQHTDNTMRRLAENLDLTFHSSLLTPTFQGMGIPANSIDAGQQSGILYSPLERDAELTPDDITYIRTETQELYDTILSVLD